VVGGLKPTARKRDLEATEETGGGGGDNGGSGGGDEDGWSKGLSKRQRTFYETQIGKGLYKGHADPRLKKELARIRGSN